MGLASGAVGEGGGGLRGQFLCLFLCLFLWGFVGSSVGGRSHAVKHRSVAGVGRWGPGD